MMDLRASDLLVPSIAGLAVGDAMGYPAESRLRLQILAEIGADGINDFIALKASRFSRPFFTSHDYPLPNPRIVHADAMSGAPYGVARLTIPTDSKSWPDLPDTWPLAHKLQRK